MTKPKLTLIFTVVGILSLSIAGCALFGKNGAPLSGAERPFFSTVIQTNIVYQVVQQTNTINQIIQSVVNVTNEVGAVVVKTNTVIEPKIVVVQVTNTVEQYEYTHTPNAVAQSTAGVAGTISNLIVPGSGGAVTTGILGLFSLWAGWRSKKNKDTGVALSQEIETILEFVYSLPKGAAYHESIVKWLQEHQVEAGVAQEVLKILEKTVDNRDAVSAMEGIRGSVAALGTPLPPRETPPSNP